MVGHKEENAFFPLGLNQHEGDLVECFVFEILNSFFWFLI